MDSQSVRGSAVLPQEGQSVEFVLDGRGVAMDGTYTRQTFQSRWSGYAIERVHSWRSADLAERGRHEQLTQYRSSSSDGAWHIVRG